MAKKTVLLKWIKDGVCRVTLNRPNFKNALNDGMIKELQDILQKIKENNDLRVLILTGSEDSFSAGADLNWMKRSAAFTKEENIKDALLFAKLLNTIDSIPRPTIAQINGHAFGGGLGILSACDFSICSSVVKFSFSEVKLGLIPEQTQQIIAES